MKNAIGLFFLLLLACSDKGVEPAPSLVEPGKVIAVRFGEQIIIAGTNVKIRFADVGQDSRCPADAICVWAGNADVFLEISGANPNKVLVNTTEEPRGVFVDGFEIRLQQLDPYPLSAHHPEKKEYVATLAITALIR